MSCSTRRMARPSLRNCCRSAASFFFSPKRSPAAGSSSSMTCGSAASARAISRSRCWPSARLPAGSGAQSARSDAVKLVLRLEQEPLLLLPLKMNRGCSEAGAAAQMGTERDILQNAHLRLHHHMLERAGDPVLGDPVAVAGRRCA